VIDYGAWQLPLSSVSGIYNRTTMSPALYSRRFADPLDRARHIKSIQLLLECFDGPVANRPHAAASNDSKLVQYRCLERFGFRVPATIAGGSTSEIVEFARRHGGEAVVKSTSGERSRAKVLRVSQLAELLSRAAHPVPHQFQQCVRGLNVRVHVAGRIAVACAAHTEALDYRYASEQGHAIRLVSYQLPSQVAAACVELTGFMGLDFSGIDLLLTPDHEWYGFEVNTAPGYSWFEENASLTITEALAYHLGRTRPQA
jgi:glutathione synthase/RimK-type ligase-like ATP-grasp enzyme